MFTVRTNHKIEVDIVADKAWTRILISSTRLLGFLVQTECQMKHRGWRRGNSPLRNIDLALTFTHSSLNSFMWDKYLRGD